MRFAALALLVGCNGAGSGLELAFEAVPAYDLPVPQGTVTEAVAADLDGDGLTEIVLARADGGLFAWRADGAAGVASITPPEVGGVVGGMAVTYTEGRPAVFLCFAEGGVRVFELAADLWTEVETGLAPEAGCRGAEAVDLDDDGIDEVLELREGGVRVWTSKGAAWTARWPDETGALDLALGASPTAVTSILFEDRLTLVVGTSAGPVLVNQNGSGLSPAAVGVLPDAGCSVGALAAADLDRDGLDELVAACAGQDRLYRPDGDGGFIEDSLGSLPIDGVGANAVVVEDFDLDGWPDLGIGAWDGLDRIYLGTGDRFFDETPRLSLDLARTVAAFPIDADSDGAPDWLSVQASDSPRLFLNVSD